MLMHSFDDSETFFPQAIEDTTIAGCLIPKGYINGTLMCKNQGKQVKLYLRLKTTKEYIAELDLQLKIDFLAERCIFCTVEEIDEKIEELREKGDKYIPCCISITEKNKVAPSLRGVWLHPDMAVDCASWISSKFKVWANRTLYKVIRGDFTANSPEALQAKEMIQRAWEVQLIHSREERRRFTDCLKESIILEHGEDFYNSPKSAAIFAKYTAIAQDRLTGFQNFNGTRENCTEEQLDKMIYFENKFATLFETFYPDDYSFDELFELALRKMS
ncbi:KilA-N domain-containing protein [Moorena sp. SIO3A2]|uniref:KilA-N domain-containing protein n=1 Tax=Moorena sp. SIO3A2 TaxID=2607841 RepID=UPI0013B92EE9|nr:KilA-N domain-containing protein [Moorena sp. SIO3A2]NER90313.1 KilA-N domain-containing protein [Moorena sp. SIO3A2]